MKRKSKSTNRVICFEKLCSFTWFIVPIISLEKLCCFELFYCILIVQHSEDTHLVGEMFENHSASTSPTSSSQAQESLSINAFFICNPGELSFLNPANSSPYLWSSKFLFCCLSLNSNISTMSLVKAYNYSIRIKIWPVSANSISGMFQFLNFNHNLQSDLHLLQLKIPKSPRKKKTFGPPENFAPVK